MAKLVSQHSDSLLIGQLAVVIEHELFALDQDDGAQDGDGQSYGGAELHVERVDSGRLQLKLRYTVLLKPFRARAVECDLHCLT